MDISNYDRVEEEHEDECSLYYSDLKSRESLAEIVNQINQRYAINGEPMCTAQSICYNITLNENAGIDVPNAFVPTKVTLNKGLICIFDCVPRTLIEILLRNPLEFVICEDLDDDQTYFGLMSINLSKMGFINAIGCHFYEKGYNRHSHPIEKSYEVKSLDGTRTIGECIVRVKLTCHGPETRQVNPIFLDAKNEQPLQPIFLDVNDFDFPVDLRVDRPPQKIMYDETVDWGNNVEVLNREIKDLLDCEKIQVPNENKQCACPCKELLEKVKEILYDDNQKQYELLCMPPNIDCVNDALENSDHPDLITKTRPRTEEIKPTPQMVCVTQCFSVDAMGNPNSNKNL